MSSPIIEVNGLSKRYQLGQFGLSSFREESDKWLRRLRGQEPAATVSEREFWALRDVSFSVNQGEVVGIIGRNGAGKSTLLKILSRITEPTAGEIILRGRVASLLEVGTGFHPELSGRDNIFLNGAILGMKRAEIAAKFDEIVAFAEVGKFLDTPVKRYSSGMYVKLAFAVAAHLEPDILVVDEVLAVGDSTFQKKCVAKMGEVAGHGRTVLFVSHNIGLIHGLCRTAVVLDQGRVVHHGDVGRALELYTRKGKESGEKFIRTAGVADPLRPHINSVQLRNPSGSVIIHAGEPYEICVQASGGLPHLGAIVHVRDQSGVVVQYFNTAFQGDNDSRAALAPHRFTLTVPRSSLPPGTYSVDAELWLPEGRADIVENACRFEVSEGEFEGRQSRVFAGRCATLTSHQWCSE